MDTRTAESNGETPRYIRGSITAKMHTSAKIKLIAAFTPFTPPINPSIRKKSSAYP